VIAAALRLRHARVGAKPWQSCLVIPAQAGIQWRNVRWWVGAARCALEIYLNNRTATLLDDSLRSPLRGRPAGVLRATRSSGLRRDDGV